MLGRSVINQTWTQFKQFNSRPGCRKNDPKNTGDINLNHIAGRVKQFEITGSNSINRGKNKRRGLWSD